MADVGDDLGTALGAQRRAGRGGPPGLTTIGDAVGSIGRADLVAFGGGMNHHSPAAVARELVRAGRPVRLFAPYSGWAVDLLIGHRLVCELHFMFASLESCGLAPSFRAAAQAGELELCELDGPVVMGALRAGACDLPWMPIRRTGNDVLDLTPGYRADVDLPDDLVAVRAVHPDIAFLQAGYCDPYGNLYYCGTARVDFLLAGCSARVVAVVEEIREPEHTAPGEARIPSYLVDAIAVAPGAGWPGAVAGYYPADHAAIGDYVRRVRAGELVGPDDLTAAGMSR